MSVKIYNKETGKFVVKQTKYLHIGPVKKNQLNNNKEITYDEKLRINDIVSKIKYLADEFGVETVVSYSNRDIFKISDDFEKEISSKDIAKFRKLERKKEDNSIEMIKKQLGVK